MKFLIVAPLLFSYALSTYDPTSERSEAKKYLPELYKGQVDEKAKFGNTYLRELYNKAIIDNLNNENADEFYECTTDLSEIEDEENIKWYNMVDEELFGNRLIQKEISNTISDDIDALVKREIEIQDIKEKLEEQRERIDQLIKDESMKKKMLEKIPEEINDIKTKKAKIFIEIDVNRKKLEEYIEEEKQLRDQIKSKVDEKIESTNYVYIDDQEKYDEDSAKDDAIQYFSRKNSSDLSTNYEGTEITDY